LNYIRRSRCTHRGARDVLAHTWYRNRSLAWVILFDRGIEIESGRSSVRASAGQLTGPTGSGPQAGPSPARPSPFGQNFVVPGRVSGGLDAGDELPPRLGGEV